MTAFDFAPGFSTPPMAAAFSAAARVAAMCRVEAALARAQADAGVVPPDAAEEIAAACAAEVPEPELVLAAGWDDGTPLIPLLRLLRARLPGSAAHWLHHGATSQDVIDSALMLQARDGLASLDDGLSAVARPLRELAAAHRDTITLAWTLLQPAEPTTVGLRVAGWLEPTVRHLVGVRSAQLPVQLGGPVGTRAALGAAADAVVAGMAAQLGLAIPLLPWHTDRTPVVAIAALLERIARTMSKIGTDLALLAQRGEARMRAGGSSSMPGKHNPIDATRAIAAAEVCFGAASVVTRGRAHELERGVGGWHAEWAAVPLAFASCGASVDAIRVAVESLEFEPTAVPADASAGAAAGPLVDRVVALCDEVV